jgi:hypothetical protein
LLAPKVERPKAWKINCLGKTSNRPQLPQFEWRFPHVEDEKREIEQKDHALADYEKSRPVSASRAED